MADAGQEFMNRIPKTITPDVRKRAEELLKKAKVQLAIHQPFFAQIVFNRRIAWSENPAYTASMSRRGRITLGYGFVSIMTIQQVVFLLSHEAMHFAMLHTFRRAHREPRKWNRACDMVINDLLKNSGCGEEIPGGTYQEGARASTSEKIYDSIKDQPSGGKRKGKDFGGGNGDPDYSPGSGFDDLDEADNVDESEARELESQAKVELAAAAQVAKQKGNLPAGLERIVDELVKPTTPWHSLLERFMTSFIKSDHTWKRPNRRHLQRGLYLPSASVVPTMGPVVIAVDTSGSIGQHELQHFMGHINAILEKCRPEMVYVIPCDARVYKPSELTLDDLPLTMDMMVKKGMTRGGGGTSFKPPFRWVEQEGIEPDIFVYLTDLYGDFPAAPQYPVIWLATSDVKEVPFGDVIRYEINEAGH